MDSEDSYIKKDQFSELKYKELNQMRKRTDATGHGEKELVGLAISGGGIRSAIFALDFLQSLPEDIYGYRRTHSKFPDELPEFSVVKGL
ncbi:hypothetical protein MNBD_GAMMA15-1543 [hydrothermal vent metagenome]|uniref:PNPLA domain-containing protein n=1 Tax=hydrothermal vent metagenome TaxID=652676 RepID=A0A3B0YEG1_9ZZZZ